MDDAKSFDKIISFENIVDLNLVTEIYRYAQDSYNWNIQLSSPLHLTFDHPKHRQYDIKMMGNLFWQLKLDKEKELVSKIFSQISSRIGNNFEVKRCYINGQSSIQDGDIHSDDPYDQNSHTFILYINPAWHITWGGCTVFLNQYQTPEDKVRFFEGDTSLKTTRFLPRPGAGILFPGNYLHYAEGPSKNFRGIRMSLAFKLSKSH